MGSVTETRQASAELVDGCGGIMPTFTIERTNDRPLKLNGEMIARAWRDPGDMGKFARWYNLALYRSESGKYVAEVVFMSKATNRDGTRVEEDDHDALVCDSADAVIVGLGEWDALEPLVGFPVGIHNRATKQRQLEDQLNADFEAQVGKLLAEAAEKDDGFVEEI